MVSPLSHLTCLWLGCNLSSSSLVLDDLLVLKEIMLKIYLSHSKRHKTERWALQTYLPPANEVWGKVIFLHLFVILFMGGVCLSACWDTHPWADTPQEQTPPGTRHPPAEHAGRYSQRRGGTHPTGMQSCCFHAFDKQIIFSFVYPLRTLPKNRVQSWAMGGGDCPGCHQNCLMLLKLVVFPHSNTLITFTKPRQLTERFKVYWSSSDWQMTN